jgi:hypothetical protein
MNITKGDIGKRVWSFSRGWGTIESFNDDATIYPIYVQYDTYYTSKLKADSSAGATRVVCVKLTGEYEVEEED